jgi:hypothetical protein
MTLFAIIDGARHYETTIEKRAAHELMPGDVARGVIDGKPITGKACTILEVSRGSARTARITRRVPCYRIAYDTPSGSAGVKFLTAHAPVSVEVAR